jgi:hypothetical protein
MYKPDREPMFRPDGWFKKWIEFIMKVRAAPNQDAQRKLVREHFVNLFEEDTRKSPEEQMQVIDMFIDDGLHVHVRGTFQGDPDERPVTTSMIVAFDGGVATTKSGSRYHLVQPDWLIKADAMRAEGKPAER